MKLKTSIWSLCIAMAFTTLQAQDGQGLRLFIGNDGLQETPATQRFDFGAGGKVTHFIREFFLTQDIVGQDYAIDFWCKTEPADSAGNITAEIKIGEETVADTVFEVIGTDWQLYHYAVKGSDPTITRRVEVQLILTIENGTGSGVTTWIAAGNFGEPQTSIVIPAPLTIVSVQDENIAEIPEQIALLQNYPNPFNPSTRITYSLPELEYVNLKVYDILGKEVAKLVGGYQSQGVHTADFDASDLAGGTYFYRLQVGDIVKTKVMILVR